MNALRMFVFVLFGLATLSACSKPKNMAVARSSLSAGIVYHGQLKRIVPIYVSSYTREIYSDVGGSLGSVIAEEAVLDSISDFRVSALGGSLGAAVARVLENRTNQIECNYFITIDAPDLIRAINPQLRSQIAQPGLAEAIFARELQSARLDLQNFKREIDELGGAFLREGNQEAGNAHIAQLRELYAKREALLDQLEVRMYRERKAKLPGKVDIAIVNPCRDVSAGQEVLIIDYGRNYVIELVE